MSVSQDKFVMRELDNADVGLREDCEEDLVDVGCKADLYVANQDRAQTRSMKCMWGMLCFCFCLPLLAFLIFIF